MAKKKKKRPAERSQKTTAIRKRPTARKRKIAARKRPAARKQVIKPVEATVLQQCGQPCPLNRGSGGSHHGACYLDFAHTNSHRCSVDGFEWA